MAQIEAYLKRKFSEMQGEWLEDIFDLYEFVPNEELKKIFAIYHTQLNRAFSDINSRIKRVYDDEGNVIYKGGYFHAGDSREYLSLIDEIEELKSKLSSTEYAFRISEDSYDDVIRRSKRFIVKYNGSAIPEGFEPINIIEFSPVFTISKSVSIVREEKKVIANLQFIGEGSYAQVFKYIDTYYDCLVVIKRARPELDNKEMVRFRQEFDVLKSLNSPYVVEVYGYDEERKQYSMEYLDETIFDYIRRVNDKLSLEERKRIIAQVCRGFKYIHEKNLLHRDISLKNVFIKHYEDVNVIKLADFGLVKVPDSTLTSQASEIKGSLNDSDLINVGFDSYEMCHEIFALTRLCYYILTGRTNIDKQKEGRIKQFWYKGTNPNKAERYKNVDELYSFVQGITEDNK